MTAEPSNEFVRDFGRYIVFVDESGDHGPVSTDYPVFALAFCIFEKATYADTVTSALHHFKFKHFGHDTVVLHESDIRRKRRPFEFLNRRDTEAPFLADLAAFVGSAEFTVIASVIRKDLLASRGKREHPYHVALEHCLERLALFLGERGVTGLTHVVCESRGRTEDETLELEFRRLCERNSTIAARQFSILFADKKANHCGLQVADLVARPIGVHVLRPDQSNQAWDVVEPKLRRSERGKVAGYGLKVWP